MTCENVWPHSMISAEMPLSFCTRWSRTHKAWCDTALLNPVIHTEPSTQQHTERNRTSEWTLVRTLNARRSRDYRIGGCHESKQGSEHEIHIFFFFQTLSCSYLLFSPFCFLHVWQRWSDIFLRPVTCNTFFYLRFWEKWQWSSVQAAYYNSYWPGLSNN